MEVQPTAGSTRRQGDALEAGAVLVGRYEVARLVRRDPFGEVYEATAVDGAEPYTLHVVDPDLASDRALLAQVGGDVRAAVAVQHVSVARPIELASDDGRVVLVTELAEGHTLRELLQRKRDTGQSGFGAKGAANIALHLCGALVAAHEVLPHGAVSLDNVVVSRAGRVRLTGLGLLALAPRAAARGSGPATAPEVIAGARPTVAADVYGLGAVLYEILVGAPPIKGCKRPSEALPGLPPAIDQIVARCMSAAPQSRPKTVAEVRDAISNALAERTIAPTTARPSAPLPAAPSLAESLAPGRPSGVKAAAAAPLADAEERWLISKGKLDYGPFTLAAILDQIRSSQILPGHVVIDKDTGDRKKVEDHPLLAELVEQTKQRRDEERRAQAEVVHVKQERRRGATLYVFIFLAVAALGGGGYVLYGKLAAHKASGNKGVSGLAAGSVEASMSFPTKAERAARRSSRKAGGKSAGGMTGGWNDTVELDMDEEGGDERLDDSQVNPVLQGSGRGLGRCLTASGTHDAKIEFIVKGTGKVSQVRVNGETGSEVANCIRGVMKSLQFPTFNGQRSKHYFDMSF
jgi:serine/threonine-protein kinase